MIGMNLYNQFLSDCSGTIWRAFSSINVKESEGVLFSLSRDFQRTGEVLLGPVLEALAPVANITMESQVCEFLLFI